MKMKQTIFYIMHILIMFSLTMLLHSCSKRSQASMGQETRRERKMAIMRDPDRWPTILVSDDLMGEGITERLDDHGNYFPWSGDLGVLYKYEDEIHVITGDVLGSKPFKRQALGWTDIYDSPVDGLDLTWRVNHVGNPIEISPYRTTLAPGGAITLKDEDNQSIIYIFMQDVKWEEGGGPHPTRSVLFKSVNGGESFIKVWTWLGQMRRKQDLLVPGNISPVRGRINDKDVIFMLFTGLYRQTPLYLAYCYADDGSIEDYTKYHYFSGMSENVPIWRDDIKYAIPVIDSLRVGELCVQWCDYLNQYLLGCFIWLGHTRADYYFFKASNLWGSWERSDSSALNFWSHLKGYRKDWRKHYGGYFIEDHMIGSDIYWIVSLWVPYSTDHSKCILLLKTDLSKLSWSKWSPN